MVKIYENMLKRRGYDDGVSLPVGNIIEAYLVGGQSNADGRVTGQCPSADTNGLIQGIQMFNSTSTDQDFYAWQLGVNAGSFVNGNSTWAFDTIALKQIRDYKNKSIYVVKATEGNTSMSPTASTIGSWYIPFSGISDSLTKLGQIMKDRINLAFDRTGKAGKVLKFKAILWHQGEGDYASPDDALYKGRMQTLITRMRGWCRDKNLPLIMGSISQLSGQYSSVVDQAQREIDNEDPNVYLVDMSDKTLLDAYHFDYNSTIYFGNEVFNILKGL